MALAGLSIQGTRTMRKRTSTLFLSTVFTAGLMSTSAFADTVHLQGKFQPEHGADNPITGQVSAELDTTERTLSFHLDNDHLSGPITAAHLHGPATPDKEAGVLVPILKPYGIEMHGLLHLSAEQVSEVKSGKTYINLHTAKYPAGEARAQLTTN